MSDGFRKGFRPFMDRLFPDGWRDSANETDGRSAPTPSPGASPSADPGVSSIASANAPMIFFDSVPTMGFFNGVAHMSLSAMRFMPGPGGVMLDTVMVAHLRMNSLTLQALKDAIAQVELLARPAPERPNN
jgi:hypothetical protein